MREYAGRYPLLADEDLISLVADSDAQAFALLYDRHSRAAYSLTYRLMNGRQPAEDLVQEAFIKVWRSAGGYRAGRGSAHLDLLHSPQPRHRPVPRAIDQFRSAASRRRTRDEVEASAPTSEPSEAFAETWRNTQQDQVREVLKTLPQKQLRILELAYFSGYTHVEIAERLSLPLGTVKGRMRLGLEKLRNHTELREMAVV